MTCEGCNTSGCCCSPLSQFANPRSAGLHPDHINHEVFALVGSEPSTTGTWGTVYQLVVPSVHLVALSVFADPNNVEASGDLKGIAVMLFEASDPDDIATYTTHHSVMLKPGESYTLSLIHI